MADQQKADSPQTEGQQTRGSRTSARGTPSTSNADNAQSSGSSSSSGQSAQQPADQERQRQVSREPGTSSGTGMQRGSGRQTGGRGTSLAGRGGQPSVLPALIANPELMASAFMSNPFAFAQAMSQEMDRLFDTYTGTSQGQGSRGLSTGNYGRGLQQQGGQQMGLQDWRGRASWEPQMEVFQRGNEIVVRADLPGVSPDDVEIDIEDGMLTISGERRETREDREEGRYHSERIYGAFARSIALPDGVNEDQIRARFDNGVLEVTIPASEQQRQRGRRVQIQSGAGASGSQGSGQIAGRSMGSSSSGSQTTGGQSASGQSASGQSASGQSASGQSAGSQSTGSQSAGQQGSTQSGTGSSSSSS